MYWLFAYLLRRKFTNCIVKFIQRRFACKIYSNVMLAYMGYQTKLSFSSGLALMDFGRGQITSQLYPNYVLGITGMFVGLVMPFVHYSNLKPKHRYSNFEDLYFNQSQKSASSRGMLLLRCFTGPLLAVSILTFDVPVFILIGVLISLCNITVAVYTKHTIRFIGWISVGMNVCFLLYHLSMSAYSLSIIEDTVRWNLGYGSMALIGVFTVLKVAEIAAVIFSSLFEVCKSKKVGK